VYNDAGSTYNITNVTVNGNNLIGWAGSLAPGESTLGMSTSETGSSTIVVSLTGLAAGEKVTITGFTSAQCDESQPVSFTGTLNSSTMVITYEPGTCP